MSVNVQSGHSDSLTVRSASHHLSATNIGSSLVERLGGLVQLHRHRRRDEFVRDHLDIRASAA